MSDVLSRALPAPKRWQELESLAFDVYRRLWQTTDADLHGRTGQPQAGVDVFGTNRLEKQFTGVQCKGKDADYGGALTEAELRDEVAKALMFQPPLDVYIVLTTAPNDVAIQRIAREITAEHARKGLFEVRVTGWDTFRHYVADHQDLLLKYFRDFAPVDVVGAFESSKVEQRQDIAQLTRMLQSTQRMVTGLRDDKAGTDELATRVNEVSKLIADGSPKAALKRLDALVAEEGDSASPLARYRLRASKGNAYYALGDETTAISFFREAYDAYPEFPNARATMAVVHLFEGDREKAFGLASAALAEDPTSARTAGIVLDTAPKDMSLGALTALLQPDLLDDLEIKLHLAIRAHELGDEMSHRRFAEEALALAPEDWRALSAVAEALSQPLVAMDGLALTHVIPVDIRADVEKAAELNGKAWEILAQRDSSFQGRHVAANLVSLLSLLGRDEEATVVLDQALATNATYDPLVFRTAQRFASNGDWKSAAHALDQIPETEMSFDALLMRTQAALILKDAVSAAAFCERLAAKAVTEALIPERDQLIEALRVRAAILAGADHSTAFEAAIKASPNAIVLRSVLFDDLGEEDPLRLRMVDEIRALAVADLSLRERVHAAETLYEAGHFSLAADLFEPLHDTSDSHALRRRLNALLHADRRADARRLFESLAPALRSAPGYVAAGVNIYERVGLLKPAIELLERALKRDDNLTNRLSWMQLLARSGRHDAFHTWLRAVPEDIAGEPRELMSLARVIDRYLGDDPKALAIGYRALRAGYKDPQIHLGYALGLIINGTPNQAALAAPAEIGPGAGVTLRNEATGELIYRVIETAPDPVVERGELAPSDTFAKRLLGLKLDDTIEIAKVGIGPQPHKVTELQSRYLFAHHRTLRDFPGLFPGHPAFGSFEIDESKGDEKYEQMFALARDRAAQGNEIETLYRENILPLPMAAKFGGATVFDVWEAFSANPSLGLKCALGVAGEFDAGRTASMAGITLVDPLTLYGWTRMGVTAILAKSPYRLAVVQATIDMLRELVEEREAQRGKRLGTFGWDGERYHLIELSEEAIQQQIADATAALHFAESLMLVPAESDQTLSDEILDMLKGMDPAYHDTLLASLQRKRAFLTDDLGIRAIAQEAGAAGTWTQAFVQAGHRPGGISHPEYRQVLAALLERHHRFTQIGNVEVLAELLESGWVINDRLKSFARVMTGPEIDRASVGNLLARLLVNCSRHAPNDSAFAAFHREYVAACHAAGRPDDVEEVYGLVAAAAQELLAGSINRVTLPLQLMATTNMHSPVSLTLVARKIARGEAGQLFKRLGNGGLTLDA